MFFDDYKSHDVIRIEIPTNVGKDIAPDYTIVGDLLPNGGVAIYLWQHRPDFTTFGSKENAVNSLQHMTFGHDDNVPRTYTIKTLPNLPGAAFRVFELVHHYQGQLPAIHELMTEFMINNLSSMPEGFKETVQKLLRILAATQEALKV
jgi:hypothetical protein